MSTSGIEIGWPTGCCHSAVHSKTRLEGWFWSERSSPLRSNPMDPPRVKVSGFLVPGLLTPGNPTSLTLGEITESSARKATNSS